MSELLFRIYVIVMLITICFIAESAAQNAMEAHSHAHELACHIEGGDDLCSYFKREDHE